MGQITQRMLEILAWTEKIGIFNPMNFEKKVGLSGGSVAKWKAGRDVSLDTVTKVLYAFPSISAEWLMRGEGPIEKTNYTPKEEPVSSEETNEAYVKRIEDENKFLREQLSTALTALAQAHKHYNQ